MRALFVAMLCCVLAEADAIAKSNPDFEYLLARSRVEYRDARFTASENSLVAALKTLQRSDEVERASTLSELGDVYVNQDKLAKAESAYSEAFAIFRRLADLDKTIVTMRNLGAVYSRERRHDDALRILRQGLKLIKATPAGNATLTAQMLNSLGVTYFRQGRIDKAKTYFDQVLQMVSSSVVDREELLINLGMVHYAKHQFERAEDLFKQALKVAESATSPTHPDVTFALSALATLYTDAGRYAEAEQQYLRTLAILEPNKLDMNTRIARTLHALSAMYAKAGRKSESDAALERAAAIARRYVDQHNDMAAILDAQAAVLRKQGKTNEAEEILAEARRARVAASLVVNAHIKAHNPF